MKILNKFTLLISLLALIPFAQASSVRNGTAAYTDLGSEVFLGSLYVESPEKNAGVLIESTQDKVLEVSVMNDISKRRWVNMWMQSIAINSPRTEFEKHAETLVDLFQVFKTGLKKGDVFKISTKPGKGVEITLDSVVILKSNDESLFNLFARAWIGAVPPSREFKDQLLGLTDSSFLASRVESISPSDARTATIKEWLMTAEQKKEQERLAQEKLEQERLAEEKKQKELEARKLAEQKALEEAELAAVTAEAETAELAERTEEVALTDSESETTENEQVASDEIATVDDEVETITSTNDPVEEESAGVEEVAQVEEEEEDFTISVESILAQQEYTNYIIQSIYKRISYPKSAARRGQEGTTRISLTVSRDGKLVNTDVQEESGVSSLDREAIKAISRAAPFDAFPEVIRDESQQFIIPISFRLN